MLAAMRNKKPDMVPVAPDTSNMIPCRLTGKPFWEIYLYQDPPLWEAYIHCCKRFGFDGWQPAVPVQFEYEIEAARNQPQWRQAIVKRTADRIYTRTHATVNGKEQWSAACSIYYIDNPPTAGVPLVKVGLPEGPPAEWEDVKPRSHYPGVSAFHKARQMMGEAGVVGAAVHLPGLSLQPASVYEYYDERDKVAARCEQQRQAIVRRLREMLKLKPDLILIGISGHMINNPEPIFRELSLPALKDVTRLCKEADVPSQIHCCGPEYALVKISAEESDLSNINPLEIPPMGDCDLADVKRKFGRKLSLMGNLHTTDVMLKGTPHEVREASKKAMDDAAEGGGFILSTGDQCGRDTPDENLYAMIETARTYGRY